MMHQIFPLSSIYSIATITHMCCLLVYVETNCRGGKSAKSCTRFADIKTEGNQEDDGGIH